MTPSAAIPGRGAGDARRPRNAALLPLVIGVTGHRDLREQDIAALQNQVRLCLDELRSMCPHTPLVVLSPLAEGADRLVARMALAIGAELVVPLPLPRAEYEQDFVHAGDPARSERSLAEFDDLMRSAAGHVDMPLATGNSVEAVRAHGAQRDRQYLQVGAYVARHSHLLIALWDGNKEQPEQVGGTAQIMRCRLQGLPTEFAPLPNPLDAVDAGPVVHVVTPRADGQFIPSDALTRQLQLPGSGAQAIRRFGETLAGTPLAATFRRHDIYNHDVVRLGHTLTAEIAHSRAGVIPDAPARQIGSAARSALDHYAMADTLALHVQRRRRRVLVALASIAVAAVFFFELYAHFIQQAWVLLMYPATLLVGFGVYGFARKRDFHNRHLDYRALAEGFRVQLFWQLAGLRDEVSDHYLRKQRSELEWVRMALRTHLRLTDWGLGPSESVSLTVPDRLNAIREWVLPCWIADQNRFFERAASRDHDKLARREHLELVLVAVGVVAGILVLTAPHFVAAHYALTWQHGMVVMMGLTPAIAAAISGYTERMAFGPQAKRYHWMADLFARAETRLRTALEAGNLVQAEQLVLDLGNEALGENGDWVMMHRDRLPEASKVG